MTRFACVRRALATALRSVMLALAALAGSPSVASEPFTELDFIQEAYDLCLGFSDTSATEFQRQTACFLVAHYFVGAPPPLLGAIPPRAAAGYGSLSPIPGTYNSVACFDQGGITFDRSRRFVYFSGGVGNPGRVCGFARDPISGAFTPVPGDPPPVGSNPRGVTTSPSGRFLYVAGGSATGSIAGFAIDPATGALTSVPGSPFATGGALPQAVVIDRSGRFMYVGQGIDSTTSSIAILAIDAATGALTPIAGSPYKTVGSGRIATLALTPDGRFLYAGETLGTYAVNAATGALTRVALQPGTYYYGLAVDPTGRYLFGVDDTSNTLKTFSIAANGTLTAIGVPQPVGAQSWNVLAFGDLVYVSSTAAGLVYGFRLDPDAGRLASVAGSPFVAGKRPSPMAGQPVLPSSPIQVDAGDNVVASVGAYGGAPPYTWSIAGGALPAGLTLNAGTGVIAGKPVVPGDHVFTVRVTDSAGAAILGTRSILVVGNPTPTPVSVVEFYNASLDHYFVTWVPDEIAKLDNGTFKGWARTGLSFTAYATAAAGTTAVCRIYIPPGKGDGHFFGRDANECDGTMTKNPSFVLESATFLYLYPATLGTCAAGQVPVYRVFSNRADANHRYTTARSVRDAMVGKGWLAEGDGPDTVVMCAPA